MAGGLSRRAKLIGIQMKQAASVALTRMKIYAIVIYQYIIRSL
jgi:hypothetical protein